MTQSRKASALEAMVNVGTGFILAWLITFFVLPAWGFEATVSNATAVTAIYTAVSLIRNYAIRRVFA